LKYDLDIAMRNSYEIILKNVSLRNFSDENNSYFIHNPNQEVTDDTLKEMHFYFTFKKEWDKVVKINTLRAKIKFYDTTKRLSKIYSKKGD
jgi:hypothetical protein